MKKVFVLDTNILLSNPNSIFQFDDNDIVIPISVIEEIDHFKAEQSENGRNAREVSRIIDQLRQRGTLSSGIKVFEDRENSGSMFVNLDPLELPIPSGLRRNTDNLLLTLALQLQRHFDGEKKVIVVTKDTNLRIKADAFGLPAENYSADKVDISHLYTGIENVKVQANTINEFYSKREVSLDDRDDLTPNQYIVMADSEDDSQSVYGIVDQTSKSIRMLEGNSDGVWGIFPRNTEQMFAIDALLNDDIKLVTLTGGAGTGKTLLAIAAGLYKTTDEDKYQKILVSRPIFPLGRDVGFLPGDLDEKLNPWMQPIFDNLELLLSGTMSSRQKRFSKSYEELINQNILAVEPLTYIRGRSLPNQFFVVDEAQNLTPHEIKTILTRAGDGTKIVLTGDPYQIDHPYLDAESNGLTYVIQRFKKEALAAHVQLKAGERSDLASIAADLL